MSVEVFASTRRFHENANTLYRRPIVVIRVGGRTFESDCQNDQEATEVAQRVATALEEHYRIRSWG